MKPRSYSAWTVPALLVLLSLVPTIGGVVRMRDLAGGVASAADARFAAAPLPVVLHVLAAVPFALVGAFQFSEVARRRWGAWHRRAGRVVGLAGLVVALSGVWMALAYPIPAALQGPALAATRVAVGAAMAGAIVVGWRRIIRRDVAGHEAWMIRAYALGQGAGTQPALMLAWTLAFGDARGTTRDALMVLAWLINAAVAEAVVARRAREASRGRSAVTAASTGAVARVAS